MLNSDNHNHIIYDDIQSMIKAAKEVGFDSFSITEHISQFKEMRASINFHSVHRTGRMFSNFEEYFREFDGFDHKSPKVNRGLEVDFISSSVEDISNYVNQRKWDILLMSVHELKNGTDIENRDLSQDRESSAKRWTEYIELQKRALESDYISFDVLTHPVRLGRGTPISPNNIDELLIDLAAVAAKEGKALELNGNDISRDYNRVERLARACGASNCEVVFGSDAHHPNEVGRGYEKAKLLIKKFELKQRLSVTDH
jgi:histidinol-phosphatase (PHP family)